MKRNNTWTAVSCAVRRSEAAAIKRLARAYGVSTSTLLRRLLLPLIGERLAAEAERAP